MTRKPHKGYTAKHEATVFRTYAKSRWTWDYKLNKPLDFEVNQEAHYANYCYARRVCRLAKARKLTCYSYPVTCHSNKPLPPTQVLLDDMTFILGNIRYEWKQSKDGLTLAKV